MNIFVGNLTFDANEGDIKKLFEGFGNVASVVIVMSKDKKIPKPRGFGFVQMPDEQQALAAIDALNGREFMGRALKVSPGRSKIELLREIELKKKKKPRFGAKAEDRFQKQRERKKAWFSPVFDKYSDSKDERVRPSGHSGTHRAGTRSYDSRRGSDGVQGEARPWKRPEGEAKPWKKSEGYSKPWKKTEGEAKPWRRPVGEAKPWRKFEGGTKPWQKSGGETKPWKKAEGGAKPWRKPEGDTKSWRKPEGYSKPWKKTEGVARPWKKPEGEAKPWKKSSDHPQKPRFKGRSKAGGYKP